MPDTLTNMEGSIIGKDKAAVMELLGAPLKRRYWTNVRIPDDWTDADKASFEAGQLDEIWIYATGRVHFSISGIAKLVDDNIGKDLPPDEPGETLIA